MLDDVREEIFPYLFIVPHPLPKPQKISFSSSVTVNLSQTLTNDKGQMTNDDLHL